jgi:hypothetical protein
MAFSSDNDSIRSIFIGNKVSLNFISPSSSNKRKELIGTLDILKDQKDDTHSNYLEVKDLYDKVWIQIGENSRVYANQERNDLIPENLEFSIDKQMIEDFKDTKMMYAGVDHPKYNIKTREIPLVTVRSLADDFQTSG